MADEHEPSNSPNGLIDLIRAGNPRHRLTEAEVTALADAISVAGWRPPLPKTDARLLTSLVAGVIDGHFGDDCRDASTAAAQELIDRGWLDKTGAVGAPEPVATTLRRIIRDLEEQAAGPQRHTHAGIALSNYALRLRGHPALDADADAGWPPPDCETERPRRCPALTAESDLITAGRQCQQYEGHPHDHTWYGDNGHAYSRWTEVQP